ncbi:MAG: hypothetical protein RDV41_13970, partial [Planctomycetota bacterium]|nr:hypothetical protein [Planctomycetota bacterium]
SDIYGLGATLYHMLTGRPPVKGETEQDIVLNLLETDPAPVISIAPYVPKNVSRVLERMMAKNPQRRYQSMNEVLVDLKLVRDSQEPIFLNMGAPAAAGAKDARGQRKA